MRTATLVYVVLVFWGTVAAFGQSKRNDRRPHEGHDHRKGVYNQQHNPWTLDPRPGPPVARDPNTLDPDTLEPVVYNSWTFDPRPSPPVSHDPNTHVTTPRHQGPEVYNPGPHNLEFAPGSGSVLPQMSVYMWVEGGNMCNQAIIATMECVGKIEHILLKLPMQLTRGISIPNSVVQVAMALVRATIPLVSQTKRFLEQFFTTIFELPAKALYGTISIFYDLLTKLQAWGHNCLQLQRDRGICFEPPPSVGGFGPCAGTWPCSWAVACRTPPCLAVTDKLLLQVPRGI